MQHGSWETTFGSSERATLSLNELTISPAPTAEILFCPETGPHCVALPGLEIAL